MHAFTFLLITTTTLLGLVSISEAVFYPLSVWRNVDIQRCGAKIDPPYGCRRPRGLWLCQSIKETDGRITTGWACISPKLEPYDKPIWGDKERGEGGEDEQVEEEKEEEEEEETGGK